MGLNNNSSTRNLQPHITLTENTSASDFNRAYEPAKYLNSEQKLMLDEDDLGVEADNNFQNDNLSPDKDVFS